jgi:hypothetical protein
MAESENYDHSIADGSLRPQVILHQVILHIVILHINQSRPQ